MFSGVVVFVCCILFFFFKQKTAYEMRISDWSSTCALPITRLLAVVVFGRVIERQDDAVDDIVDEGEITKHVAVIIDVDRPALENRLGEFPDRHVGPPPRAINREEAKAGLGYPEEMCIGFAEQFVRPFRRRI